MGKTDNQYAAQYSALKNRYDSDIKALNERIESLIAENEAIKAENAQLRERRSEEPIKKIDIESLARLDLGSIVSINGLTSRIRDLCYAVDEISKRVRTLSDSTDRYSGVLKEGAMSAAQQFDTIASNTYLKISPQAIDEFEAKCLDVSAQLGRDISMIADKASAKIRQSEKRVSIPATAAYIMLTILILSLIALSIIVAFNYYVLADDLLTSLLWRIGAIASLVITIMAVVLRLYSK